MSVESLIIYTAGALLLAITASRFLIQELIALVLLFKKLKAAIGAPRSLPPGDEGETPSRRDSG